ncbi:uncharacterized protein LOC118492574 [Helianthus annuus]|uniref:uncharacterized protein LOC118492574 n=1 Tax=Helianthus annuus TaxID=4232 RepID=UPI001652F98D|nr:uncharacterized protein LOC118492574 [Helianthus annuus]
MRTLTLSLSNRRQPGVVFRPISPSNALRYPPFITPGEPVKPHPTRTSDTAVEREREAARNVVKREIGEERKGDGDGAVSPLTAATVETPATVVFLRFRQVPSGFGSAV